MIVDQLGHADAYSALGSDFAKGFAFLRQPGLADLPAGRHAILGDRVYAMVARDKGRRREDAKLEAHRLYADVHYAVSGTEEIGWKPTDECRQGEGAYDAAKDFMLFRDACELWVPLIPGRFAVVFPWDAHAPLVGPGAIVKVVLKIRMPA